MKSRWISVAFAFVLLAATALAGSMFSLAPSPQDAAPQRGEREAVASISGVVTDQSGAFRANAIVTLSSGMSSK